MGTEYLIKKKHAESAGEPSWRLYARAAILKERTYTIISIILSVILFLIFIYWLYGNLYRSILESNIRDNNTQFTQLQQDIDTFNEVFTENKFKKPYYMSSNRYENSFDLLSIYGLQRIEERQTNYLDNIRERFELHKSRFDYQARRGPDFLD